jgi:hypothetical protein
MATRRSHLSATQQSIRYLFFPPKAYDGSSFIETGTVFGEALHAMTSAIGHSVPLPYTKEDDYEFLASSCW